MKILLYEDILKSKKELEKRNTVSEENRASVLFYIVALALSLAVIILMISAFVGVSARASNYTQDTMPTVVIDAGHGGEDGGATANGAVEKDINLAIALKLEALLKDAGVNVIMTRSEDVSLSDDNIKTVKGRKTSDIKNRTQLLNADKNNILISIHQNKFEQEQYSGTQVFYSKKNDKSKELAESIKASVVNSLQPDNTRETKPADSSIYILNNTENIAVLVECGFLSNKAECEKLKLDSYQNDISLAIFNGFLSFLPLLS